MYFDCFNNGSGYAYGYGTVLGGRWDIDKEGGHVVDSVSRIPVQYPKQMAMNTEGGHILVDSVRVPSAKVDICL